MISGKKDPRSKDRLHWSPTTKIFILLLIMIFFFIVPILMIFSYVIAPHELSTSEIRGGIFVSSVQIIIGVIILFILIKKSRVFVK
jgi:hypothetical protein